MARVKYHLNLKGEPGRCKAKINCPFGGDSDHYSSPEEARSEYEKKMENERKIELERKLEEQSKQKATSLETSIEIDLKSETIAMTKKVSIFCKSGEKDSWKAAHDMCSPIKHTSYNGFTVGCECYCHTEVTNRSVIDGASDKRLVYNNLCFSLFESPKFFAKSRLEQVGFTNKFFSNYGIKLTNKESEDLVNKLNDSKEKRRWSSSEYTLDEDIILRSN